MDNIKSKTLDIKRRDFFELARKISERSNLSPEEADKLVNEAVQAVRAEAARLAKAGKSSRRRTRIE